MYFQQHLPPNVLATDCIKISASKWSQCRLSEGMKQKVKSILMDKSPGESHIKATQNKYENHFNPLQTSSQPSFTHTQCFIRHQQNIILFSIEKRNIKNILALTHVYLVKSTGAQDPIVSLMTQQLGQNWWLDNKTTQETLKIKSSVRSTDHTFMSCRFGYHFITYNVCLTWIDLNTVVWIIAPSLQAPFLKDTRNLTINC